MAEQVWMYLTHCALAGLVGAWMLGYLAWRKERAPGAVALAALKGFVVIAGLAVLPILAFYPA